MTRRGLPLLLVLLAACAPFNSPKPPPAKVVPPLTGASAELVDLATVGQASWALARGVCGTSACLQVYARPNGAAGWRLLPELPPARVSHVRFATATTGYLWGPDLLTTRDGGRSWQRASTRPVEDLEIAGTAVYRLTYDRTGCPGPCARSLQVADAGLATWVDLLAIAPGDLAGRGPAAQVVPGGADLLVAVYGEPAAAAGTAHATIFRSSDGGADWHRLADPCGFDGSGEDDLVALAAASSTAVALCQARTPTGGQFLLTSADSGSSWSARKPLPASGLSLLAAPSPGRVVVASASRLYQSSDGGVSWNGSIESQAPPALAGFRPALGFDDATDGHWTGTPDAAWITADGGRTWRPTSLP